MKRLQIKFSKSMVLLIGICIIFLCLTAIALEGKKNLHEDEVFSYGLSNHPGGIYLDPEPGKKYEDAKQPYMEYMAVQRGERLEYSAVWWNQTADVHPPLYYYLLHTISSFFTDTFSVWFAGSINIVCSLITISLLYQLSCLLSADKKTPLIVCFFFAVTPGIIQANTFLRMYIMTMMWICAVSLLHLRYMKKDKLTGMFFAGLFIISTAGALTHYYFLAFLFLQCMCFGIWLLWEKRFKAAGIYLLTMSGAGAASYVLFRPIINHIFSGYRGLESFERLRDAGGYWQKIKVFWKYMDRDLFGGFFILILIFAISIVLINIWRKNQGREKIFLLQRQNRKLWLLITLPCTGYFFLIVKAAIMESDRYIVPIYGLVVLIGVTLLKEITDKISIGKKRSKAVFSFLGVVIFILSSYLQCPWTYSYQDSAPVLETAKNYADKDCIFIYTNSIHGDIWRCNRSFFEVQNYQSLTFIPQEEISMLLENGYNEYEHMMVYIVNKTDREAILQELVKICPNITKYTKISEYGQAAGYYLE